MNPGVEGLLLGMDLGLDSRHIVAYTNNGQVVILDNCSTMFKVIQNPFASESVVGVRMSEDGFLVFGAFSCVFYTLEGEEQDRYSGNIISIEYIDYSKDLIYEQDQIQHFQGIFHSSRANFILFILLEVYL